MKKSLKRLLCLVLSVLLFTMSIPVLAAETTQETTTTETPLPGLDKLDSLNPAKVGEDFYKYVIDSEADWEKFVSAVKAGTDLDANVLLKTDINLNEEVTFDTTEGSDKVTITASNGSITLDKNGKTSDGNTWNDWRVERNLATWTPIGTAEKPFTGVFNAFEYDQDGNIIGVHDISGLMFNEDQDNAGLFGVVGDGATIAGVRIIDSYVRGTKNVGAVVGNSDHGANIIGCVNGTGSVVIGTNNVGGVVGSFDVDHMDNEWENDNLQDHIYECVNRGYVYGMTNVGGIVGYTYHALIKDSYNVHVNTINDDDNVTKYTGHVYGTEYVGGIVGYFGENNEGAGTEAALELFMAYNHGTVNGTDKVGGLVGYNATRGKVFNSYSSGPVLIPDQDDVDKNKNNGNVVGLNAGEVRDCFYYPNMYEKYVEDAAGKMVENEYYDESYENTVIGNGIGSASTFEKVYHVSGLKVIALKSEAAAYLLNLVYMGEGMDVHAAGYHHLATHDFGDTAWTTPTYWMAGNDGPEFTENTSLAAKTIKSAQLLLNQNFNLKFKVDVPGGLSDTVISDRTVVIYQNGEHLTNDEGKDYEPIRVDVSENDFHYEFTLTGIEPHYLGDKFEVIFTAKYVLPEWDEDEGKWVVDENNAILVSEKVEYSVLDYCTRQLERDRSYFSNFSDEQYANLVTLLCNVLEYGAQYQIYRHREFSEDISGLKLVNAVLEEKGLAPTNFWNQEATKPSSSLTANFDNKAENIYASNTLVRFGSANALGLILYIDDIDNYDDDLVVVEIVQPQDPKNPKTYTIADLKKESYGSSGTYFMAVSDPMSVTDYGKYYVFKVYASAEGETFTSVTYNMEYFVESLLSIGDRREPAIKALWDYHCAAVQYNAPASDGGNTTGGITLDTDNIFDADVWEDIKTESGDVNEDWNNDGIPDSWVKLNISSSLARLLSIFNPLIRLFFGFEIVQYNGAWYARPSGIDWNL